MTRFPRGVLCERARSWAALAPDDELSELEQKLLDAHLGRCAGCARFAVQVAAVAAELRAAALQPLPQPVSIQTWRHRPVYARLRTVGAAAAVAVMAFGIASRAPLPTGESQTFRLPPAAELLVDDRTEHQALRNLRRAEIARATAAMNRPTRFFGNQPA